MHTPKPSSHSKLSLSKLITLFFCLGLLSSLVHAQNRTRTVALPILMPEAGITAQVQQLDEFKNYQLLQHNRPPIILAGVDRFEAADFNFDGHIDLRVIRSQGVNTKDEIYLYAPSTQNYTLLSILPTLQSQLLCKDLMNVLIVKTNGQPTMLNSNCTSPRGGDMNFDYLQFNTQGELKLVQQYASDPIPIPEALLPYTDLPWGITQKLSIYGPHGEITSQQRTSRALAPIVFKALNNHLLIQQSPSTEASTILNLAKNQICNVLNLQGNWIELACTSKDGQTRQGWLNWEAALTHITPPAKPFILTETGLVNQHW